MIRRGTYRPVSNQTPVNEVAYFRHLMKEVREGRRGEDFGRLSAAPMPVLQVLREEMSPTERLHLAQRRTKDMITGDGGTGKVVIPNDLSKWVTGTTDGENASQLARERFGLGGSVPPDINRAPYPPDPHEQEKISKQAEGLLLQWKTYFKGPAPEVKKT